jgi:transcription elongation factor Elf1
MEQSHEPGSLRHRLTEEKKVAEKKFKHICECTNCGNEAEMVVTCTMADESTEDVMPKVVPKETGKTKGHAVCAHCGGEADIWLDV